MILSCCPGSQRTKFAIHENHHRSSQDCAKRRVEYASPSCSFQLRPPTRKWTCAVVISSPSHATWTLLPPKRYIDNGQVCIPSLDLGLRPMLLSFIVAAQSHLLLVPELLHSSATVSRFSPSKRYIPNAQQNRRHRIPTHHIVAHIISETKNTSQHASHEAMRHGYYHFGKCACGPIIHRSTDMPQSLVNPQTTSQQKPPAMNYPDRPVPP